MTIRKAVEAGLALPLVLLAAGCGAGETPEPPPTDSLEADEPVGDLQPTATTIVSSELRSADEVFAHGAHRTIECRTCHDVLPSHTTHRDIVCTECHTTPERYATLRVLSDQECLECHHAETEEHTCEQCHRTGEIGGRHAVEVQLHFSIWEQPQTRGLSFDHAWHVDVECGDCHAASVSHDVGAECRSCHEDHHRADAACSLCHVPGEEAVHREAAHAGCTGRGCHEDQVATALPPSTAVCIACHDDIDIEEHNPNQACAVCHQIPTWPGDSPVQGHSRGQP